MSDSLDQLKAEIETLRGENQRLRDALRDATGQSDVPPPHSDHYEEFVSHAGVLWKAAVDGGLEPYAYCPQCKLVLLPVPSDNPTRLVCTACRFEPAFGAREQIQVANEGRRR